MNQRIWFQTPAKINIALNIVRKRPDGYHDLVLDLIPISLYDSIELREPLAEGIEISSNLDILDQENNLLVKTVRQLEKITGHTFSARIIHQKNIPVGAGLGGGSGNAAGLLMVLNHIFDLKLPTEVLVSIARKLGADIPFFLNPKPCLAEGIGDELKDISIPTPLKLLLLYPNLSISTKEAYQLCRPSNDITLIEEYSAEVLGQYPVTINGFWRSLITKFPVLRTCRDRILETNPFYCGLSGSGSTLFGIYADDPTRKNAFDILAKNTDWRVISCETLASHSYLDSI